MATTTLIAPTTAPFYFAIGISDGLVPDGASVMDFGANTGRFMAKSTATNLAEIQLIGLSNTADGRSVGYLTCGEYGGPGSAEAIVSVPLTVNSTAMATGFTDLDLTISHTRIGVAEDMASPMLIMLNASAPVDQKNWVFAALTDQLVFSAAADSGEDNYWLVADRSGTTITGITLTPPLTAPYYVANGPVPARAALPDGSVAINYSDPVAYLWSKSLGGGLGAIELVGVDNTGRQSTYLECAEPTPGNQIVDVNGNLTAEGQITAHYGPNNTIDVTQPNAFLNVIAGGWPGLSLIDTSQPSGARVWKEEVRNGTLLFLTQSDIGAGATWMGVQRSGNYASEIDIYTPLVSTQPITAPTANFNSCFVNGSPVVTIATMPPTAPETTNMLAGDGSGGFTDTGIDPSDVALLDGNNIFTGSVTTQGIFNAQTAIIQQLTVGINVLVGNNVTINQGLTAVAGAFSGTLTCAGSPVRTFANTGTGGGPPIPETTNLLAGDGAGGFSNSGIVIANVPLLNAANQVFTGSMTVQSGMTINQNGVYNSIVMGYQNTMKIGTGGGMNTITFDQYNSVFITGDSYAIGSYSIIIQVPGNPVVQGERPVPQDGIEATAITISGVYFPSKGTAPELSFGIVDNTCWFPATSTAPTATAGSAALPATPAGFITMLLAGAAIKVPYYNA
jgi:hypothetical protein